MPTPAADLPNILIVMTDDQGPWAMHCAGQPDLQTPNLDKLAAAGMRFENAFCASPVCSPARASFLTGRIPSQHGVHDWIKTGNIDVADGVTWCGADSPADYLRGQTGFTDLLAAAGYQCALSGKWHLGDSARPQASHDFWCAHALGGDSYTHYFYFDNSPEMREETTYVTDFFTDRAIDFLNERPADAPPFCLSVHYTAPHAPWREHEQPADLWQHYMSLDYSDTMPHLPPHPWGGWNPSPEQRQQTTAGYFTTITAMDRAVGRILETLDALDLARDTLVLFTSDNGYSIGHHGIMGKGNGTSPQNMYEESVKIPFIVRYPGRVPAGVVSDEMVSHYDWLPTLMELLGLPNPLADSLPGRSFAPVLTGQASTSSDRRIVIYDEYGPVRMIRDRHWKYVQRYPDGPDELYDLQHDPGESTNLVDDPAHATRLADLRHELGDWFRRYLDPSRDGARLPVTGRGQLNPVNGDARDQAAFVPEG